MAETLRRPWELAPIISHWEFEPVPGQIRGCDGDGRVLLAISANPMFGQRLAAAFNAPTSEVWPRPGHRVPL